MTDGRRVAGFGTIDLRGTLRDGATVGHIDVMVVDAGLRGRGIGSEILERLTVWARERGCRRLELDSAFHREESHAFYEARGFRRKSYHFLKAL